MAFIKRCAHCNKIMMVRPSLLERKKTCSKYCQNQEKIGKRVSLATEFKKGHRPQSSLPVGSEIISKGYARVKVTEPNVWRQKSHIAWEKANGKLLPVGWIVRHIDSDPLNDSPENLVAMSRGKHLNKTLEDPKIKRRKLEQARKATKRRWKRYREAREGHYDIFGLLEA